MTDANGCPDALHLPVDCPGDACRVAADGAVSARTLAVELADLRALEQRARALVAFWRQVKSPAVQQAAADLEAALEVAEVGGPCLYCSSRGLDDGRHVYGERKCCPDCDHRPVCDWCGRGENPGEQHRVAAGTLESGEPSDFVCLDADGLTLEHLPRADAGGPAPF